MDRTYSNSRERSSRSPYRRKDSRDRDSKDHRYGLDNKRARDREKRYTHTRDADRYYEKSRYRSRERRERRRNDSGSRSPRPYRKGSRDNSAENKSIFNFIFFRRKLHLHN